MNVQETGRHVPERRVSLALSMGSAALYGMVAIAMGFANKAALQIFGLANTLLLLQMCSVIIVVGALRVSRKPQISQQAVGLIHNLVAMLIINSRAGSFGTRQAPVLSLLMRLLQSTINASVRILQALWPRPLPWRRTGSAPGLYCHRASQRACAVSGGAQAACMATRACAWAVCGQCSLCPHADIDLMPELLCRSLGTCTCQQCTGSERGRSCP